MDETIRLLQWHIFEGILTDTFATFCCCPVTDIKDRVMWFRTNVKTVRSSTITCQTKVSCLWSLTLLMLFIILQLQRQFIRYHREYWGGEGKPRQSMWSKESRIWLRAAIISVACCHVSVRTCCLHISGYTVIVLVREDDGWRQILSSAWTQVMTCVRG